MKRLGPGLKWLLAAALLSAGPGCFGVTQNPSYFPHLLPFGDVIETHAKPPLWGYFANFDPHAVRLEVRPTEQANPVRTQLVLIATVYDEKGKPRRNRRVEWIVEGVGNLVEVDESGYFAGRGFKKDSKYGVSYTACKEHRFSRGNDNPADDFVIRPGQTWCVITSPREGDTHVTAYAPGIADWEKGRVFVTHHWVDASWEFPPPASAKSGTEHVFTTRIFRHTDKKPLSNYRVRYKILDGPPALLLPSRTQEYIAISDLNGNAQVAIAQLGPSFGVNRVSAEIIRPPDPTAPSGAGLILARGETSIEWLAPAIGLSHTGPAMAVLGQEVAYVSTVGNTGKVESRSMTLTSEIPDGLEYLRSNPPAFVDGRNLIWTLGALQPAQSHTVQAVYKAVKVGTATSCAAIQTEEGFSDKKCVTTQITTGALKIKVSGPPSGFVNVPLTFQIATTNPGGGPLDNVVVRADFDEGLEHPKGRTLSLEPFSLAAQDTRTDVLVLTPTKPGPQTVRVTATSGNIGDRDQHTVQIQQPQMTLEIEGPKTKYVGRPAEWTIRVGNPADVPLNNLLVRDRLPPELAFIEASLDGKFDNGEVVWNLGTLGPREQKVLQLSTRCQTLAKSATQFVQATAEPGLRKEARAEVEILGLPALRLEMSDLGFDPVEVGKKVVYTIRVTNTGSLPASGVDIKAFIPPEMKFVRAKGPGKEQVNGQVVAFPKMESLEPNNSLQYEIEVEALKPGDVRFRMEMRTDNFPDPYIEEEATQIFSTIPAQAPGPINPGEPAVPPPPIPPELLQSVPR